MVNREQTYPISFNSMAYCTLKSPQDNTTGALAGYHWQITDCGKSSYTSPPSSAVHRSIAIGK